MKIVLAPDSFKECMSAQDICQCLRHGILHVCPDAEALCMPMADGGEGSSECLCNALNLQPVELSVSDPLGREQFVSYGRSRDGTIAVIEAAKANGLDLLTAEERNPLRTSSRGCGQMLAHAISQGIHHIFMCIGGSATVDGGKDLAEAFGYRFLDANNQPLPLGGGSLIDLHCILPPSSMNWTATEIIVLCDVTNPLLGHDGAAHVFGPQKGATPAMVETLAAGLETLASRIQRDLGYDVAMIPGAGAAGGLGAGLVGFLGAQLKPGAEVIMDAISLDTALIGADLVITGEGCTDSQTLNGKVVAAVAHRATNHHVPIHVVSGNVIDPKKQLKDQLGVRELTGLRKPGESLEQAINKTPDRLQQYAESLVKNI